MIISHKHKFIYIKTRKTAGTSLEIALSKFLGEQDVITANEPADEAIRKRCGFRGPRNIHKKLRDLNERDVKLLVRESVNYLIKGKTLYGHHIWPCYFYTHDNAAKVKSMVGDKVWNSYFKFTVERNPWDKVVSHFFYYFGKQNVEPINTIDFSNYVRSGIPYKLISDFDNYTINGVPEMDLYIQYNELKAGLNELSNRLSLSESVFEVMKKIKAKGNYRSTRDFRSFYDEHTKELIATQFAREIAMFGYLF